MLRLVLLLLFAVTAVPRLAFALPFGQDTLIIYEYTGGGAPVNLYGSPSQVLPSQGFSVPDSGSGSFGGSADAGPLTLRTGAFVNAIGNNQCKCVGMGAYVNTRAVTQDSFTISQLVGVPGFLAYDLEVSGSAAGTTTGNGKFTAGPIGSIRVNAGAFIPSGVTALGLGGANYSPPDIIFSSASLVTTHYRIEVPIGVGLPITVWLALSSIVEGGASDGTVAGFSDYTSTLHIRSLTVLDTQHQPMPDAVITALSGTVYPAPEPPVVALAFVALFALVAARRRVTR